MAAFDPKRDGSAKLRPTEAGSEAGSKFPDCCRIRSARSTTRWRRRMNTGRRDRWTTLQSRR